jgi:hypothetical protein
MMNPSPRGEVFPGRRLSQEEAAGNGIESNNRQTYNIQGTKGKWLRNHFNGTNRT